MTPYWPSPLGATRRRLAPNTEAQTFLFSTQSYRGESSTARRFPKPSRGIKWVADADLASPTDFDQASPEPG